MRGLASFDRRSSFATWAYRVATNACFDELRRRRRRPVPVDDVDMPPVEGVREGLSVERVGARLDVDAALATLPEEFRSAVVLRDLCDLPYADIAEALGVPVGTVRSRIARGRAALAPLLAPGRNPAPPIDRPTP